MGENCSKSVSVRKIANGYVREESSWNGDKYERSETYHQDDPGLEGSPKLRGQSQNGSALRGAISALKGK